MAGTTDDEALYRLAATHRATDSGIVDVTSGDNTYQTVTGYSAVFGYDLASGLGTFYAAALVRALAHQSEDEPIAGPASSSVR